MAAKAAEKEPLTEQQQRILDFIKGFIAEHGVSPTRQEIADEFEFASTNAAQQHVVALERKGYVETLGSGKRAGKIARGLRVL